jgi:hypothetical protein
MHERNGQTTMHYEPVFILLYVRTYLCVCAPYVPSRALISHVL